MICDPRLEKWAGSHRPFCPVCRGREVPAESCGKVWAPLWAEAAGLNAKALDEKDARIARLEKLVEEAGQILRFWPSSRDDWSVNDKDLDRRAAKWCADAFDEAVTVAKKEKP